MARAALLAFSSPVPGRTEELTEWYDKVHIPDVRAAIPAIDRVVRYRIVEEVEESAGEPRFVTVYEIPDGDVADASARLTAALRGGGMALSPALDLADRPPVIQWAVAESAEGDAP
ncbi:hypothetical protein LO762_27830 [Actinocorallia sp. API 0066]|uniref:hypothetical protein n=1 Tax=Actinocorallia sp. API 0066 TaxID=2896846 RepID=UPI001E3715CE|nr:hypothetical protein [Actinocorallia sp. API 0066]MCD0452961.1 hypothetical protein [Actinocorallia sp. API 0066]